MRTYRSALCLALAGSVLATGAAGAATKPKPKPKPLPPVCNLVTDDKGDAVLLGVGDPNSDALDVISADVATGPKNLTAVIRVANLAKDNFTQHGKEYKFLFAVNGAFNYLRVQSDPTGDSWDYGTAPSLTGTSTSVGEAQGAYDTAKGTITFTVPKSAVGIKPGAKLTDLTARSYFLAGALYETWDEATGTKAYVDGTPSCVATS